MSTECEPQVIVAAAPVAATQVAAAAAPVVRRQSLIQCANCGGLGHVYRICNHPITSFGVICYRVCERQSQSQPEYLLVQRKDSLSYVEFIRGKYSLQNRGYVTRLLSNMTPHERDRVRQSSFDDLWYSFWQTDHTKTFVKEYEQSSTRFNMLRRGYYLRSATNPTQVVMFDMATALDTVAVKYDDTEWGFPKGRRNINETDLRCACREFKEEAGVDVADIHIMAHVKPFEEIFTGSNKVRYRHVYYLAHLKRHAHSDELPSIMTPHDIVQQREIRTMGWFNYDDVCKRIREENVERREMFKRVHQWVLQNEIIPLTSC